MRFHSLRPLNQVYDSTIHSFDGNRKEREFQRRQRPKYKTAYSVQVLRLSAAIPIFYTKFHAVVLTPLKLSGYYMYHQV
jgi:hypothetical protein